MTANFENIGYTFANQSAADDNDGSGFLVAGDQLALQVQTDSPVFVSGSPFLQLSDGLVATFDPAGTTAQSVNFIYTVQPGDATDDLRVLGLIGSVTDDMGNPLAGAVAADVGVMVDAQPPAFTFNPGFTFNDPGTVTFSGTVSDNVGVTNVEVFAFVNGKKSDLGAADVDEEGNWSFTADFGGPLKITKVSAETSDPAGNVVDVLGPRKLSTGGGNDFVYTAGSGPVVIDHFQLTGRKHDVLTIPRSEVASLAQLAAVVAQTHNLAGGGVFIPFPTGDSITFGNLTKAQLRAEVVSEISSHKFTDFKLA